MRTRLRAVWPASVGRGFLRHAPAAALLLLLAFGVRFHRLDTQSLWNDEGNSLRLAQRGVSDLIDAAGRDIHPPGYYLALKLWTGLAGDSEFSLRALSAFAGVLAVAATLALGRIWFGRAAGMLAGLLVALSPFAVYYSQEARMYAPLAMWSALSMWAFVRWWLMFTTEDTESTEGNKGKERGDRAQGFVPDPPHTPKLFTTEDTESTEGNKGKERGDRAQGFVPDPPHTPKLFTTEDAENAEDITGAASEDRVILPSPFTGRGLRGGVNAARRGPQHHPSHETGASPAFSSSSSVISVPSVVKRFTANPRRAWRWALLLALINAAGLYTQYSFPFTLLVQGGWVAGWLVWRGRRESWAAQRSALAAYVALNALTLALFLPWLPTAWDQVTTWPRTGVDLALDEQLHTVLTWLVYGNTAGKVAWSQFLWPGLLVVVALWPGRDAWRAWLPLAWALVVTGALVVSGAYREANLKFLLPAQIALALLIAQGAARLWSLPSPAGASPSTGSGWFALTGRWGTLTRAQELRTVTRLLAGTSVFLIVIGQLNALHALYTDPAYARDDYRAMAAEITRDPRPGDAIILDAPNQAEVFGYYYDGKAPIYELPPGLGGDDAETRRLTAAVIRDHRRLYALFWGEDERDPNRVVKATLDTLAYPVTERWVGDVRFAQYHAAEPGTLPIQPLDVRFGEHIFLTGAALTAESVTPGRAFGVYLLWQTDAPLGTPYKVSVQLLAPDGFLVWQHDAEPVNNLLPTTQWEPGLAVEDRHGLYVPPERAPGAYRVIVAVYDGGGRLPVTVDGVAIAPDYAELATIPVQ